MPNPHDQLSPEESCSILRAHVRYGIELARKYRLNRPIREAIAQHHGDSVIAYFFQRAEQLAKKSGGKAPDIADYRYDGPRPHRPEVVIVKICRHLRSRHARPIQQSGQQQIAAPASANVNELLLLKCRHINSTPIAYGRRFHENSRPDRPDAL